MKLLTLLSEQPPKDLVTFLWIVCGVLGSVVVALAVKLNKAYNDNIKDKNEQIASQAIQNDKEKEKYENILEKSLNALTGFDKSITETSIKLPSKLVQAFKEGNEPLIQEIRKILDK